MYKAIFSWDNSVEHWHTVIALREAIEAINERRNVVRFIRMRPSERALSLAHIDFTVDRLKKILYAVEVEVTQHIA